MKSVGVGELGQLIEKLKSIANENEIGDLVDIGFQEVAARVGYEFPSGSRSIGEVKDFIRLSIGEKIKGGDISGDVFHGLLSQLKVEYYLNPIPENKFIVIYISFFWDTNRSLVSFTSDENRWIEAFELLLNYRILQTHDYAIDDDWSNPKERNLAIAIKYFQKRGFLLKPKGDSIDVSDQEFDRILVSVDRRTCFLGQKSFDTFIGYLRHLNKWSEGRYSFVGMSRESNIPIGYLLRLSMKYMYEKDKKKLKTRNRVDELKELAVNVATLYGVQEHSQWEHVFHTPETILDGLRRIVLSDGIYAINQFDPFDVTEMVEGFFSKLNGDEYKLPWAIDNYISVMKAICNNSKYNCSNRYTVNYIFKIVNYSISLVEIESILDSMSHDRAKINCGYLKPEDMEFCDFQFKPLVKSGEYYDFHDKNLFSFGFYEVISSKLRSGGLKEQVVGGVFEDFFSRKLSLSNISHLHGEEYSISKPLRDELGTNREQGECDFIVETNDTIMFIELKKKILSRKAQAGDVSKISYDLVSSFSTSILQANWHEIILRKNGVIRFKSGRELHLKGRSIEKVSVSQFDYMGLHDNTLIHQIMNNLIGQKLVSDDISLASNLKKINRILKELSDQYSLPEMAFYKSINSPLMFDNCRFFNLFHFLQMLRDVRSSEDLKEYMNSNKRISTGTRDWYSEVKNAMRIRPRKFGANNELAPS